MLRLVRVSSQDARTMDQQCRLVHSSSVSSDRLFYGYFREYEGIYRIFFHHCQNKSLDY